MDRPYEFDPSPQNWLLRVASTPLGDALRGRFSGRHDVLQEIAASGLPSPVAGLIYAIIKKTRLWRSEKLDVAKELINHFSDGLAAGHTPQQLVADFGSMKQSAALIRQAKLRQRPAYWQTWWYASRAFLATVAIMAVAYGLLAARFLLTRPSINHNYWEEINASRAVPEAERAWPLYREALLALKPNDRKQLDNLIETNEQTGPRASELVDRCQKSLDLIRQAAHRPHLGYLMGDPANRAAALAAGNETVFPTESHLAAENVMLIQMTLEGIFALPDLARLMTLDTLRAAEARNGARIVENIQALLAMSAQAFQPKAVLVEQLIGTRIFASAVGVVGQILRDHPESLSDEQLRDLAHAFAAYRNGDLRFDLEGERLIFLDQLQRIYSDDGHGDGRVSPEGLQWIGTLAGGVTNSVPEPQLRGLGPGIAVLIANRAEAERFYDELMAETLGAHEGPPWLWNADAIAEIEKRYDISAKNPTARLRHILTYLLTPWVNGILNSAERTILRRDSIQTAIALVLWKRRHDAWPERLDQLVPSLLPSLPIDRFDGQPLRYVVRDGKPVLYAIGRDYDDDGGTPSIPQDEAMGSFGRKPASTVPVIGIDSHDGDWILWPPLPPEPQTADDESPTAAESQPAP